MGTTVENLESLIQELTLLGSDIRNLHGSNLALNTEVAATLNLKVAEVAAAIEAFNSANLSGLTDKDLALANLGGVKPEKGAWIPDPQIGGVSLGGSWSRGEYTKLGNLVTCYVGFDGVNKLANAGTLRIYALPFTVKDIAPSSSIVGGGAVVVTVGISCEGLVAIAVIEDGYLNITFKADGSLSSNSVGSGEMNNSVGIRAMFQYYTND